MAVLARTLPGWLCSLAAFLFLVQGAAAADSPSEYQVKAIFLFNFSHFVDWPAEAFKSPTEPFIIGVLGADPFGPRLDEAVRGEHIAGHPLVVRRFNSSGRSMTAKFYSSTARRLHSSTRSLKPWVIAVF
jgi:hypothetical protein